MTEIDYTTACRQGKQAAREYIEAVKREPESVGSPLMSSYLDLPEGLESKGHAVGFMAGIEEMLAAALPLLELSKEQRELVLELAGNMAKGETGPLQLTGEAGRMALARFEAEAADLSAEECATRLQGYLWDVSRDLAPERVAPGFEGNPYAVQKSWTLKGLRDHLARERFLESITCNVSE